MLAYLFPGQGSQCIGMGQSLFDLFRDYTQQADEVLGYSIEAVCSGNAPQQLNQTQYTQPALYVVNALMYLKLLADGEPLPDYVAGHSLGEYNALFAAGVFDFTTGLLLVKKRGELMSQAEGGGMAAVIGLNEQDITQILQDEQLTTITIANYNSYQQTVLTGPKEDIGRAQSKFAALQRGSFIPLNVSGAFHSFYMSTAQQAFEQFISPMTFTTPRLPVISNVDARPYHPAIIKPNLIQQIVQPVQWIQTIEYLQTKPNIVYKEVGPGHVLTGLLNRMRKRL